MDKILLILVAAFLVACGGPDRFDPGSDEDGNDDNGDDQGQDNGSADESAAPPDGPTLPTWFSPTSPPSPDGPADFPASCRAKGFNYPCWYPGCYQEEEVPTSLAFARSVGADWLAIVPTWYQAATTSNTISEHGTRSPTTTDVRSIITRAQSEGFKILMKPHIDLLNGDWRGNIQPSSPAAWRESYEDFIYHFADLSEELSVDVLAIGTELKKRSGDTFFWQNLIAGIRERYSGELTYAANWDEYELVAFWSDLDFIGIDFYHPLTGDRQATVAEMIEALDPVIEEIHTFAAVAEKTVLFTEIGYRSVNGTNTRPYDFTMSGAVDEGEQADAYRAALTVLEDEEWLDGIFWWRLDPRLTHDEDDYSIYGKTAEAVLEEFWGGDTCQ